MEETKVPHCTRCNLLILDFPVRDMQSLDLQWHCGCLAEAISKTLTIPRS